MKGMYWVTKSGTVVESRAPFTNAWSTRGGVTVLASWKTAPCFTVETGGFRGNLRLDRLRPACRGEIRNAKARAAARAARATQ